MPYDWKQRPVQQTSGGASMLASVAVWVLAGAVAGGGYFAWTQRRQLKSLVKDPKAKAVAGDLQQAAKDFAEEYIPAAKKWDGDKSPVQPSASQLSAPVDPTHTRGRVVGYKGSTSRSLGVRRRVGERDMSSASDAEEYRQDMRMEVLQDNFVVPFWDTDLGRGIKYSAAFSTFFAIVGCFLFMTHNKHGRTF